MRKANEHKRGHKKSPKVHREDAPKNKSRSSRENKSNCGTYRQALRGYVCPGLKAAVPSSKQGGWEVQYFYATPTFRVNTSHATSTAGWMGLDLGVCSSCLDSHRLIFREPSPTRLWRNKMGPISPAQTSLEGVHHVAAPTRRRCHMHTHVVSPTERCCIEKR